MENYLLLTVLYGVEDECSDDDCDMCNSKDYTLVAGSREELTRGYKYRSTPDDQKARLAHNSDHQVELESGDNEISSGSHTSHVAPWVKSHAIMNAIRCSIDRVIRLESSVQYYGRPPNNY